MLINKIVQLVLWLTVPMCVYEGTNKNVSLTIAMFGLLSFIALNNEEEEAEEEEEEEEDEKHKG